MSAVLVLGSLASLCSIASFAPQAWRIIRTRETKDLSASTYALTVTGFALWVAYGVALEAWPIIVTNAICFGLAGFILVMLLLPPSKREEVARKLDPERSSK